MAALTRCSFIVNETPVFNIASKELWMEFFINENPNPILSSGFNSPQTLNTRGVLNMYNSKY